MTPDLYGYGVVPLKAELAHQDQVDFIKNAIENNISEPCWILGHSVGGAITNILTSQYPELVKGIINIEGNFTLKDAFWCQEITKKPIKEWESEYLKICGDPEGWLVNSNITPSPVRIPWAKDFHIIRNTGHMMMLEKPEKLYELIRRIIDTNE